MKLNIIAQIVLGLALGAWAQAGSGTWKRGKVEGTIWDVDSKIAEENGYWYDARVLVLFAENGGDTATCPFYFNTGNPGQVLVAEQIFNTTRDAQMRNGVVLLNLDESGWIKGVGVGEKPAAVAQGAGPQAGSGKTARALAFRAPGRADLRDLLGRGLPAKR